MVTTMEPVEVFVLARYQPEDKRSFKVEFSTLVQLNSFHVDLPQVVEALA